MFTDVLMALTGISTQLQLPSGEMDTQDLTNALMHFEPLALTSFD